MGKSLCVESLTKRIGGRTILDNISLSAERGEYVGLVGANGAGKTSLLKCICGLWKFTEGKITVEGMDVRTDGRAAAAFTGALIEYPSLFGHMTLRQNIDYFGSLYNCDYAANAKELAAVLGLEKFYGRKVKTFSSGMKQKACLLAVLMKEPSVLLLDEPTSMLDPVSAADIRNFLTDLRGRKRMTMIISGHNLHEIEQLCDRAVMLDKGRILRHISPEKEGVRLYRLRFKDGHAAQQAYARSADFDVVLRGNEIILKADGALLKRYFAQAEPDFEDIKTEEYLEQAFLDAKGGSR